MPLVKVFVKQALSKPVPLQALQASMCEIWGTTPQTTKLMLSRVAEWTGDISNELGAAVVKINGALATGVAVDAREPLVFLQF